MDTRCSGSPQSSRRGRIADGEQHRDSGRREAAPNLDEAQKERQLMRSVSGKLWLSKPTDWPRRRRRAPVVVECRAVGQRAQQGKAGYLEERLAQCAVQNGRAGPAGQGADRQGSLQLRGHPGRRRQAGGRAATVWRLSWPNGGTSWTRRRRTGSWRPVLDRELLWADERLMSAAAVANSARRDAAKDAGGGAAASAEPAGPADGAGDQAGGGGRSLLQQAEAGAARPRRRREKRSSWSKRWRSLEAVLAQREEQLQQAALDAAVRLSRAEFRAAAGRLRPPSDELAADVLAAAAASRLRRRSNRGGDRGRPESARQAAEEGLEATGPASNRAWPISPRPFLSRPSRRSPAPTPVSELRREAAEQRAALEAASATEPDSLPRWPTLASRSTSHLVTAASRMRRLRDAFDDFQATALAPLKARVAALANGSGNGRRGGRSHGQNGAGFGRLFETSWSTMPECSRADNHGPSRGARVQPRRLRADCRRRRRSCCPSRRSWDGDALALWKNTPLGTTCCCRSCSAKRNVWPNSRSFGQRIRTGLETARSRSAVRAAGRSSERAALALARQRQAVKSWLDDARQRMDDLLANAGRQRGAGRRRQRWRESADELAGTGLNERLADVKMLGDEERGCADREGRRRASTKSLLIPNSESLAQIEKIVDDAIAMKAVLDDRLAGLERRATAFRAVGDFADKVRQAQQALASVESRAAVLAPSVESASSEQVEQLRRELEALKVLGAAAQRLPACRDSAAAANALAPGVLAEEERRSIETRLASLEAQAERASARIEAALSALICRSDYLDYVTADAEINDLIGSQLARVAAVSADAKEADDRRRRPQQLLRLQDFKDAADAQRDRATGAAWDRLSAAFEERAQALETARSLLRLLADCERAENALLEVKPLLDAYQATGEARPLKKPTRFFMMRCCSFRWIRSAIDALLADAAALSNSAAAASSGDTADPEVAAAASRAQKSWSESRPRLDQCRQELDAKVRYHRFRRAGDELDRELDRFGELLDADDAAVSEGDSASVADRIQRNCRVRDTEAKKLAGLLAKMRELRGRVRRSAAALRPAGSAPAQDERRAAEPTWPTVYEPSATGRLTLPIADWLREAAGAVAAPTVEEAERRLALNRDRRTELERRLAEAAKLRLRAADLATASTVAAADSEGGGGGMDFAMALKEPREQLEAARLRVRQPFERHSEILSGDAACAQLAERV
uniref:RING-type domain-containing protein n=1 Tax=Macrostomum lignano TaxID=282301 RepID=A0A1I8FPB7_9PLAT